MAETVAPVVGGVRPHVEYQERPLDWITEHLDVRRETLVWSENPGYEAHEWDGHRDPLKQVADRLAEWEDVGIESGTGTGKTFLLACLVYSFLACWENSRVVTVAPKEDQLTELLWAEIGALFPRFKRHFPQATLTHLKLRMRPGVEDRETWAATGLVSGVRADETVATRARGFHAEHMLIITDETPGIPSSIMLALENTCTAPHNLRIAAGNPERQSDALHQFCLQESVRHIRVSGHDAPNVVSGDPSVVPGAVSRQKIERDRVRYAHDPAMYNAQVRGISPEVALGAALNFRASDHLETISPVSVRYAAERHGWTPFGGIDFGSWRFCFLLLFADRARRAHVVAEVFSQQEDLDTRAKKIAETLEVFGVEPGIHIWGDQANRQDIIEINRAFKRQDYGYQVEPVDSEHKIRSASVERLNSLLQRKALLFRRDLGAGEEWRLGQDATSDGEPHEGSRLLWEIRNWRYPEPGEGKAQKQDPDDNTADGADAIAALRYAVMSWWHRRRKIEVPERPKKDRDPHFEKRMEQIRREQELRQRRWT